MKTKPFTQSELLATVRTAIKGKCGLEPNAQAILLDETCSQHLQLFLKLNRAPGTARLTPPAQVIPWQAF